MPGECPTLLLVTGHSEQGASRQSSAVEAMTLLAPLTTQSIGAQSSVADSIYRLTPSIARVRCDARCRSRSVLLSTLCSQSRKEAQLITQATQLSLNKRSKALH